MKSIALVGKAKSGKSTAAQFLVENYGYTRLSFAKALKDCASLIWGPLDQEDKDAVIQTTPPRTLREIYFLLGTEVVRNIDANAWVNIVNRVIDNSPTKLYVVDDVRFPNELETLRVRGFISIRLSRPDEAVIDHKSETLMDEFITDFRVTNDGSFDSLYEEVLKCLQSTTQTSFKQ